MYGGRADIQEEDTPVLLPPPDYSDMAQDSPIKTSTPSPDNMVSSRYPFKLGFRSFGQMTLGGGAVSYRL